MWCTGSTTLVRTGDRLFARPVISLQIASGVYITISAGSAGIQAAS
jgi:hypothetical protein